MRVTDAMKETIADVSSIGPSPERMVVQLVLLPDRTRN